MAEPNALTHRLEAVIKDGNNAIVDEEQRSQVIRLAQAASVALETRFEAMKRISYSAWRSSGEAHEECYPLPPQLVSARISQDHGILQHIAGNKPTDASA